MVSRSLRLPGLAVATAIALGLAAVAAFATEVVVLKSGGRIEGELANKDRARTDPVVITMESGLRLALNPAQVARVIVKKDVEKQYEELLPKVANTISGHWEMARWCKEVGLDTERKVHLEEVLRLEPNHEEARRLLGYSKFGDEWMKPDEWMRKQGYVSFEGKWCLPQEIEIVKRERAAKDAAIKWRQEIKRWLGWIQDDGRRAAAGMENLRAIRDEAAAPALVEMLSDASLPRRLRLQSLEVLARMPAGYATSTLITLSMKDPDEEIRDKCLEELRRQRSTQALHAFIKDLKSKDNKVVCQAAHCLGVLGDPEATLPLIDALVTSHKFQVTPGGNPGQLGAAFGGPTDGSGGGLGSFSFGSPKPQIITRKIENSPALTALTAMHPGVNFHFDQKAWKNWLIDNKTSADLDLRRGE